jgi:hypothetical protein
MSMRFLLIAAGAALAATAAFAQTPPAPEPEAPSAKAEPGLSDLSNTVEGLQDQPAVQPTPAPAQPTPALARPPVQRQASAFPLTAAEIATINRTIERGRLLIALSRAGILATQDMLGRVPNPEGTGIDGWIAEPEGQAIRVSFFDNTNEGPKLVYRAEVLGGRITSRDTFLGTYRPDLGRAQARLVAARNAVVALGHTACSPQGFNIIVVPPASAGAAIDVYEISAPSQRGRFPLGGHFRTAVSGNGQVGETHAFASGCADLTVTEPPAGQSPPPIQIAAGTDPFPTEAHILTSVASGRALTFTAGDPARIWLVAGPRIAEIRDGAPRFLNAPE